MRQVILTVIFTGAALAAEYGSHLGSGQIEAGGGVYYREDFAAKPVFTVGYRAGLGRFASIYADYGYVPLWSESAAPLTVSANLMDYGGGVQFHSPVGRFEPYGLAGIGATRFGGKASIMGGPTSHSGTHHFNFAGGGGMRIYLLRHLGASVEYRAVKAPDYALSHRATLGLFFHLPRAR